MNPFVKALCDLFSYLLGEPVVLKSFSELSAEITELVGNADFSWIPFFLSPLNLLSLFVVGFTVYIILMIFLVFPWLLLKRLSGFERRRKRGK